MVHGAFGIVYDDWAAVTQMAQNFEGSWPDIGQQIPASRDSTYPPPPSPTPTVNAQNPFGGTGGGGLFPPATPFTDNHWFFDPNYKNAYSEQWNFGVQQQLSNSLALRMDYVGSSLASHQRRRLIQHRSHTRSRRPADQGRPIPIAFQRFMTAASEVRNYNALQVQLDKRYTNGFTYQVAYTWSKA